MIDNELIPRSLLVVEDSRIQARILAEKLQERGYHVRIANNGQVGLDMIRDEVPDLVISDIEMPVMTGYELCAAVKGDSNLRTIPFILLSTLADAEDIIKGLHCGADNYVTKPYEPDYLIARVESLLDTPIPVDEDLEQLEVNLAGNRYTVRSGRQQVLNLLVSTFENAVNKNQELLRLNEELTVAKQSLQDWNKQLEEINRRMTRDLDSAAKVQQSLLPSSLPSCEYLKLAWQFLPCDELAGDFLNVFKLDEEHLALYVVDVSGHGVASSLLAVTVGRFLTPSVSASSLLVQIDDQGNKRITPPAEVAFELNQRFQMEEQNGLYFTIAYGVLNTRTLEFRYTSAGHDPMVVLPRQGRPQLLEAAGLAIGFLEGVDFDEHSVQLKPGDRLFLYSDGVPEAMDAENNEFGEPRMLEIMELGRTQPIHDSVELLLESVRRWCQVKGPKDDVTIMGVDVATDMPWTE